MPVIPALSNFSCCTVKIFSYKIPGIRLHCFWNQGHFSIELSRLIFAAVLWAQKRRNLHIFSKSVASVQKSNCISSSLEVREHVWDKLLNTVQCAVYQGRSGWWWQGWQCHRCLGGHRLLIRWPPPCHGAPSCPCHRGLAPDLQMHEGGESWALNLYMPQLPCMDESVYFWQMMPPFGEELLRTIPPLPIGAVEDYSTTFHTWKASTSRHYWSWSKANGNICMTFNGLWNKHLRKCNVLFIGLLGTRAPTKENCLNASKLLALESATSFWFCFIFWRGGCFLEGRMSFDSKVRSQALRTNIYQRRKPRELSICVPWKMLPHSDKLSLWSSLLQKEPLTMFPSDLNEFSLQDFLFRWHYQKKLPRTTTCGQWRLTGLPLLSSPGLHATPRDRKV